MFMSNNIFSSSSAKVMRSPALTTLILDSVREDLLALTGDARLLLQTLDWSRSKVYSAPASARYATCSHTGEEDEPDDKSVRG